MLAKYIQKGECIDYTPEAAVAAGDVVVQGALTGVAKLDIEAGKLGALALHGLYDVAKGANAIAAGAQLYWDAANKVATTTSTGNTALGKAAAAAGASDPSVQVLLNE